MNLKTFFGYKYTTIRILTTMIVLFITQANVISGFEDIIINVGGIIVGSVVAEIVVRITFYIIFVR
jgi:hypothetical protein